MSKLIKEEFFKEFGIDEEYFISTGLEWDTLEEIYNDYVELIPLLEKEAEYMLESARTQIEKERLDMENNMKTKILDLSLKLNSKIFNKESANKDFIEKEYDLLVK